MGLLILLEGQYFKGDVVRIGAVEGTVEEVGLRRTLVRDPRGVLHSISNGDVRASANLTRTYAVAMVNIDGVADRDLEAAIAVLETVGRDLAADPALAERVPGHPGLRGHDRADRRRRHASGWPVASARRAGCRSRSRCAGGSRPGWPGRASSSSGRRWERSRGPEPPPSGMRPPGRPQPPEPFP